LDELGPDLEALAEGNLRGEFRLEGCFGAIVEESSQRLRI
jgi:hypothetical protein